MKMITAIVNKEDAKSVTRALIKEGFSITRLSATGADVTELADRPIIRGRPKLSGGMGDSFNDHRIAMMLAVAATRAGLYLETAGLGQSEEALSPV